MRQTRILFISTCSFSGISSSLLGLDSFLLLELEVSSVISSVLVFSSSLEGVSFSFSSSSFSLLESEFSPAEVFSSTVSSSAEVT
jgi:hypothetical protein